MLAGSEVVAHDLKNAAWVHLNGCVGVIVGEALDDRVTVRFEGSLGDLPMKRCNVRLLKPPFLAPSTPTCTSYTDPSSTNSSLSRTMLPDAATMQRRKSTVITPPGQSRECVPPHSEHGMEPTVPFELYSLAMN
eukprot:TRINITY_DN10848_c0_g2_i1.p1 TRINITY_DN10848_c0_g2~~TRINITY_DN10848_c0_g2_i1.p1  ORF type:complete len:134 (+),score=13.05 TRINITY_DN10848_c0_g2_i1:77-478(+)